MGWKALCLQQPQLGRTEFPEEAKSCRWPREPLQWCMGCQAQSAMSRAEAPQTLPRAPQAWLFPTPHHSITWNAEYEALLVNPLLANSSWPSPAVPDVLAVGWRPRTAGCCSSCSCESQGRRRHQMAENSSPELW